MSKRKRLKAKGQFAGHTHAYYGVVLLYFAAVVAIAVANPFALQALRLISFDSYQRLAPRPFDPELPVRIVDIDEASLRSFGQWPWPRNLLAQLADRLHADGAATIAFDGIFPERDRLSFEEIAKAMPPNLIESLGAELKTLPSNDAAFAKSVSEAKAVLGVTLTNDSAGHADFPAKSGFAIAGDNPRPFLSAYRGASSNLPELDKAAAGIGAINWIPDRDQVVRRVPLMFRVGERIVPSLATEALRVAQGAGTYVLKSSNASGETAYGSATGLNHIRIGMFEVPTDSDGAIWLRYRATRPDRFISAAAVLQGKVEPDALMGRIVLVGTSAPGLVDLRATPLNAAVPGVEIHAQILEHILSGDTLTRPDYAAALEIAMILSAGAALAFFLPRMSAGLAAFAGAGAILLFFAGAWSAYTAGLLFDAAYPSFAIFILIAGSTLYSYWLTERRRAEVQRMFGQYVAPDVVKELVTNPKKLALGGEERELTLLFSDVRNFSSISETMTAVELTRFLNELLTPVTDIVTAHRGTIDKYMGDGIMAFWNAPLDDADHARHAVEAAEAIQAALPALNRKWKDDAEKKGRPFTPVRLGVGINTGLCCVGNLGSANHFDYSAIGDEVNVTSRFEGLTKFYGVPAIVGETTVTKASRDDVLEIDLVRVVGRKQGSRIFTLLTLLDLTPAQLEALAPLHRQLIAAYRTGKWDAAEAPLDRCREIAGDVLAKLYEIYDDRIAELRYAELPVDWDGVYTARQK